MYFGCRISIHIIEFVLFPTSLAVYSLDTDWDMTFGVLYNDNIDQSFLAPIMKIVVLSRTYIGV